MGHFLFNVTAPTKALSVPSVLYSILKSFSMLVCYAKMISLVIMEQSFCHFVHPTIII